ncbi:MAG TPA: L-seryl-tRNA(Sec) selenium transferase [Gemmatimonadaceae bacterium]
MSQNTDDARRRLPSVGSLLESGGVQALLGQTPRSVVVDAIRRTIDAARLEPSTAPSTDDEWVRAVADAVAQTNAPSLRRVINATGVVLHTNLGRAPLAAAAIDAIVRVAQGFSNLEYDLEAGARGSRYVHCRELLRELTGAEDALVVNNGAAALVLVLNTVADGREAIVSRGELVEIGGSFRVPDIMRKSGARLVEVGTTNRTHAEDYERAVSAETGAILKVHRSNFALAGFVAEASIAALSSLGTPRGIPVIHDLGSGLLISLAGYGLDGEPTAREALRAGATIVTMSGDKLLGGPQAGIILGSRQVLDRVRKNPLTRSYRVDKLTLAALEATLALYRDPGRAVREIPALAQLTEPVATLRDRAVRLRATIDDPRVEVVETKASVGGGAFPTAEIPSAGIAIGGRADAVEKRLRQNDPPIVGRIAAGRVILDLRTVAPSEDADVVTAVRAALE